MQWYSLLLRIYPLNRAMLNGMALLLSRKR
nr:MAG TPA: hypothetical protein [Caudoviricetes sp.]